MTGCLAIIPARVGSKGVPGKNILEVGGKPLIAWSIEQALSAESVARVIVTTDDELIAHKAESYGAEIFWRSSETATDDASSESALLEVINAQDGCEPITVFLQATSPLRQPHDIDRAVALLSTADSVFSARTVHGYTWRQGRCLVPDCTKRVPRQLHQTVTLEENGSIYVMRTDLFVLMGTRTFGVVKPYVMHPLDGYQIDTEADIALIEQLMPLRLHRADYSGCSP